jgi:hypothetical protein
VVFQELQDILQMVDGELWLHERILRNHDLVLVHGGFLLKCLWQGKVDPVFWLLRESMENWNADFVACQNFLEILLPTLMILD